MSRIFDKTKTLLTLPSLWTHRTRPQGTWKLQNSFHSANSVHHQFEKDLNPNRREPHVSTVCWDFTRDLLADERGFEPPTFSLRTVGKIS